MAKDAMRGKATLKAIEEMGSAINKAPAAHAVKSATPMPNMEALFDAARSIDNANLHIAGDISDLEKLLEVAFDRLFGIDISEPGRALSAYSDGEGTMGQLYGSLSRSGVFAEAQADRLKSVWAKLTKLLEALGVSVPPGSEG